MAITRLSMGGSKRKPPSAVEPTAKFRRTVAREPTDKFRKPTMTGATSSRFPTNGPFRQSPQQRPPVGELRDLAAAAGKLGGTFRGQGNRANFPTGGDEKSNKKIQRLRDLKAKWNPTRRT